MHIVCNKPDCFFQPDAQMSLLHLLKRNQPCDEIIATTDGKVPLVTLSRQIASYRYFSITCLFEGAFLNRLLGLIKPGY